MKAELRGKAIFLGSVLFLDGALEYGEHEHADQRTDREREQVEQGLADGGHHEDAAVGRHERAAEQPGETARNSGAERAGGDDLERVGRCVGDRALGDEGETHYDVHNAVLALIRGPAVLEEDGGKRDRKRGHHAADHDGGHDLVAFGGGGGEHAGAEYVGSLVERAAHVDGHHRAEDAAEEHAEVMLVEPEQTVGERVVDNAHDGVDRAHHHGNDAETRKGVDEHGLETLERTGKPVAELLKQLEQPACEEAREQSAEEAGGSGRDRAGIGEGCAVRSEIAANDTYEQTGSVGYGHCDEAREDREHEVEGIAAHRLEPCRNRSDRTEGGVARSSNAGRRVDKERYRDEYAAGNDEGQHVRNAVHEVLVELASEALIAYIRGGFRFLIRLEHGRFAVHYPVYELLGLMDAVRHLGGPNGLAVEARGVHALIRGDDYAVAIGDLLGGEHVLRAAGAVRFDLDRDAELLAGLVQRLSRHIGMRDAGGACGHGEDAVALLGRGCGSGCLADFLGEFLGLLRVDEPEEFLGSAGAFQLLGELGVHKKLHHTGKHLHMHVAVGGGGDHEQELAGVAVGRIVIHARGHGHRGERGRLDGLALGVGNGDLHAYRGGAHRFALEDAVGVCGAIFKIAAFFVKGDQQVDRFRLACGSGADPDAFFFEQIGDSHFYFLLLFF